MTGEAPTSLAEIAHLVLAVVGALEDASGHLGELDSVAGDGDHGLTMAEAARGVRAKLAAEPPRDLVALLDMVANEFAQAGGAMGAIAYVLVEAVGHAGAEMKGALSAAEVAQLLAVAQDAVTEFGGAQPGDKTIIDSINAARTAASESAGGDASAVEALRQAARGARRGADATAGMIARVGRSSRLGEISRGTVDPGAESFAIAMEALAATYAGEHSES